MNNKGNPWHNWMHAETTQGHLNTSLARPLEKTRPSRNNYTPPVKMRFEWEGKIYEGTAYYVGDTDEQEDKEDQV